MQTFWTDSPGTINRCRPSGRTAQVLLIDADLLDGQPRLLEDQPNGFNSDVIHAHQALDRDRVGHSLAYAPSIQWMVSTVQHITMQDAGLCTAAAA
jgi:hypothetical protein